MHIQMLLKYQHTDFFSEMSESRLHDIREPKPGKRAVDQ